MRFLDGPAICRMRWSNSPIRRPGIPWPRTWTTPTVSIASLTASRSSSGASAARSMTGTGDSGNNAFSQSALAALPFLGEQLVRADAVRMVVGDRGDDQLVGTGGVPELLELVGDLPGGTGELGVHPVGDQLTVRVGPDARTRLSGRGELDRPLPRADAAYPCPVPGGQLTCLRRRRGDHDVGGHADVGPVQVLGRPERGPVPVDGFQHGRRADVVVSGEPQAVRAGHLGALAAAAAQDPELDGGAFPWYDVRLGALRRPVGAAEQGEDVTNLLGVVLRLGAGKLQQRLLHREPRRGKQVLEGEPRRNQQAVVSPARPGGRAPPGPPRDRGDPPPRAPRGPPWPRGRLWHPTGRGRGRAGPGTARRSGRTPRLWTARCGVPSGPRRIRSGSSRAPRRSGRAARRVRCRPRRG